MEENFISESVTLKCRVCQKEMLRKNYKQHLKIKHAKEDSDDVTPFGQAKVTNWFKKKVEVPAENVRKENITVDGLTADDTEEVLEENRKRRHESADSGVGEDISGSSKKSKDMAPEEITNKDLDDKLDKILKCVEKSKGTSESADKEVLTENTKVLKAIKYARSMDEVIAAGFATIRTIILVGLIVTMSMMFSCSKCLGLWLES